MSLARNEYIEQIEVNGLDRRHWRDDRLLNLAHIKLSHQLISLSVGDGIASQMKRSQNYGRCHRSASTFASL